MKMEKTHSVFMPKGKLDRILGHIVFTILSVLLMAGCMSSVSVSEAKSKSSSTLKVIVLPFKNMSRIYGRNVDVRSPISGKLFLTGDVIDGAEDILLEHLIPQLKKQTDYHLIPTAHVQGVVSKLLADNQNLFLNRQVAIETGRELHADAVMLGHVYRFKQRVGTRYAIESAASVAFDIYLIDVMKDRVLWDGYVDETQRALSENLLQLGTFLKRKGSWITAEEMALSGLYEILLTLP